jgi:hypothetical protein
MPVAAARRYTKQYGFRLSERRMHAKCPVVEKSNYAWHERAYAGLGGAIPGNPKTDYRFRQDGSNF